MGERGPVTQPTALVKQKGYYRPSRYKDEVADAGGLEWVHNNLPSPPEHFDDRQIEIWNTELSQAQNIFGYISFIDLRAFEQYCIALSELMELQLNGVPMFEYTDKGKKVSADYKLYREIRADYLALCREFGFTPASRSRVKLQQSNKEEKKDEYTL